MIVNVIRESRTTITMKYTVFVRVETLNSWFARSLAYSFCTRRVSVKIADILHQFITLVNVNVIIYNY